MGSSAALTNAPKRRLTGGGALAEMLKAHGVGPMFGMGGFQLLPFYDALRPLGLTHHLINDERSGAFAADAYARVSNRPGVCDATLGPGATNLITGLVESQNASVPLIALTGDTNRAHSWKHMLQESRQVDILRPAVKEVIRIEQSERIPELVRRAFEVATSGRPGSVVLDVPEDVSHAEFDFAAADFYVDEASTRVPARRIRPAAADIERAAKLLARAKRPLILAGGGVHLSQAYEDLLGLVEDQTIPVAHTMSGKGSIPCIHPLSAGIFGLYSRIANDLLARADCILVVGCKLGHIATRRYSLVPPEVPVIHLDILAEEFGRTTRTEVALWGDAAAGLADLRASLGDGAPSRRASRAEYAGEVGRRMKEWRDEMAILLHSKERPINMARLLTELNLALPESSILVGDGGFAGHWSALLYDTKRAGRSYIADRGFASIGYGLPGSIGAQLAAPHSPVVAITGDCGLNMTIGELETARRAGAPVTIVVVNNAASGFIKALQHAKFGGRYQSTDLLDTNYADVARAFGCDGIRVDAPEALDPALRRAIAERDRPLVIDVVVTRDPARMEPKLDTLLQLAKSESQAAR